MRLAVLLFLSTASSALGQTPEWDPFYTKQTEFRKRGDEALKREHDRRKAERCGNSANGNAGISSCLSAESKSTDDGYLAYVRSIGALLRLTVPGTPSSGRALARLPFDDAESA